MKPPTMLIMAISTEILARTVIKDDSGKVIKLLCHVDLDTLGKNPEDRKVKGVIHWLHADSAIEAKVRNLGRLFTEEKLESDSEKHFTDYFNQESSSEVSIYCEPSVRDLKFSETCQFERIGYFCRDKMKEDELGELYFNQTISLKDSFKSL